MLDKKFLRTLTKCNLITYRGLIDLATDEEIKTILEVAINLCHGVIPVCSEEIKQMIRYKALLRLLCLRVERVRRRKDVLKDNHFAIRKLLRITLRYV